MRNNGGGGEKMPKPRFCFFVVIQQTLWTGPFVVGKWWWNFSLENLIFLCLFEKMKKFMIFLIFGTIKKNAKECKVSNINFLLRTYFPFVGEKN